MIRFLLRSLVVACMVFTILLFALSSHAQSRSTEIEELKRQIEQIQTQNQQQIEELRKKIEDLEAQKQADEKTLEELATKKEEEEKDSWWKKVDAGIKDGLFFKTRDGNLSMKFNLYGQVQFSVNDTDDNNTATNFNIRRLRLI